MQKMRQRLLKEAYSQECWNCGCDIESDKLNNVCQNCKERITTCVACVHEPENGDEPSNACSNCMYGSEFREVE